MSRLSESIQTQAPFDRTQAIAYRRKTIPVLKMSEEIFAFGLVQPAHESSVLVLQTVQGIKSNRSHLVAAICVMGTRGSGAFNQHIG